MRGARPMTDDEIERVYNILSLRDRTLFILGCYTGYRISELLSIKVVDIFQHNQITDRLYVARKNMKGKNQGRSVLLHPRVKDALKSYLCTLQCSKGNNSVHQDVDYSSNLLFPIGRVQAYRVFRDAYNKLQLPGKLGTHCLRKSFCQRMYSFLDKDLHKLQKAMGHVSINSTVQYLSFNESDIDEAVLSL